MKKLLPLKKNSYHLKIFEVLQIKNKKILNHNNKKKF